MIRAVIIDDENSAIETLSLTIDKYCPDVKVVDTANNITEAKKVIESHRPDLIFLDVNMPGGTGIDLLQSIENKDFEVIFTTAHSKYAIQAIRLAALDYILKPIDFQELRDAIDRFQQRQSSSMKLDLNAIKEILHHKDKAEIIGIPTSDGVEFIKVKEIIFCESARNYTMFHMADGHTYVASKTLGDLEELLNPSFFCRIHKSFLININQVKKYIKGRGGQVIMRNDQTIEVARNRKDELISRIGLNS